MSRHQRIIIELLAPPLLGAFTFTVTGCGADSITARILGFVPFVVLAYAFAIVPSFLCMLVMEAWYGLGFRARCGLICTVGLSALLGCGAGLALEYLLDGSILARVLLWIGAFVGLLVGFYVGRQPNSQGGANARQPFGSDSNGMSPAAASRRSP
jgi:hypothetical protein